MTVISFFVIINDVSNDGSTQILLYGNVFDVVVSEQLQKQYCNNIFV